VVAEELELITEFTQVVNSSLVAEVQAVEGLETVELAVEAVAQETLAVVVAVQVITTKVDIMLEAVVVQVL
jgi:hypothetical protein